MRAVVEHGSVVPVRLQKAAKQIAHNRVVVDDKDLWIHLEILDWRARRAADCFLTNTYLAPPVRPAVFSVTDASLVEQGQAAGLRR
ncbi:hypothetical protein [Paraburkholderia sp. BCC1885]|uniref:hypothetical protein n=1 Tax=Paraburkholderia sp. BCC1885 TaxID=2562669 RepID=UPI0016431FFF|nr:hypothetical protein [Paraburkholderia sp. BCC1885]